MSEQQTLWHDSIEDALRDIVAALGGPKTVGHALWPGKTITEANRFLARCLDAERHEKLSLGELVWLLKRGRAKGVNTAFDFLARECGYKWETLEPEDERAKLQREYIDAVKAMQRIQRGMEKLNGG